MWGNMVLMYKNEGGLLALYRGLIPTVMGVAPYVCALRGKGGERERVEWKLTLVTL